MDNPTKKETTYHKRQPSRLRTYLAGAAIAFGVGASQGCAVHRGEHDYTVRPGIESIFNPEAEHVNWERAGHINGYQAFMENDHPYSVTGSILPEFAITSYIGDIAKFPFLMMRKGYEGLGEWSLATFLPKALLYIGHPITEIIEGVTSHLPGGRSFMRGLSGIGDHDSYQHAVIYGREGDSLPNPIVKLTEEESDKVAAYDRTLDALVTGSAAAGAALGGSGNGSSGNGGGNGVTNTPRPGGDEDTSNGVN